MPAVLGITPSSSSAVLRGAQYAPSCSFPHHRPALVHPFTLMPAAEGTALDGGSTLSGPEVALPGERPPAGPFPVGTSFTVGPRNPLKGRGFPVQSAQLC